MKVSAAVFAFLSLTLPTAFGQKQQNRPPSVTITAEPRPSPSASQPTASDSGSLGMALQRTSARIKSKRPEIPDEVLQLDQYVINDAFPQIAGVFRSRDMQKEEAVEASMSSWELLRVGERAIPPSQQFNVATFTALANDLGKLIVKSKPDQAKVEIDGSPQEDLTEWRKWMTPSTYRVRVSKDPDHEPVEEDCKVVKGKKTVFDRELPPKAKPPASPPRRRRGRRP